MLTFEKVLAVFQGYLEKDTVYEVVQTSRARATIRGAASTFNSNLISHSSLASFSTIILP